MTISTSRSELLQSFWSVSVETKQWRFFIVLLLFNSFNNGQRYNKAEIFTTRYRISNQNHSKAYEEF